MDCTLWLKRLAKVMRNRKIDNVLKNIYHGSNVKLYSDETVGMEMDSAANVIRAHEQRRL